MPTNAPTAATDVTTANIAPTNVAAAATDAATAITAPTPPSLQSLHRHRHYRNTCRNVIAIIAVPTPS
jgi:hypothetical protein